MTNISNMFLPQCWILKTTSRTFYNFIKMTIYQDLGIFNSWHLSFLIVLFPPFHKNEILESWHNWLLSNFSRLLNWSEPGSKPQPSKLFKRFAKTISINFIKLYLSTGPLANFFNLMNCGSKDILKNTTCLMY